MNALFSRRIVRVGLPLLILILVSSATSLTSLSHAQSDTDTGKPIFLPLIQYRYSPTVFGIEMSYISPQTGLDLVLTSGTKWVRRNGLLWKEIEPVEGAGYQWDLPSVKQLEQEMITASQNDIKLVLVVRSSPPWSIAPNQADCAPINPSKYANFANFMATAVARYSVPPYNVHYWEIGNEPDAYIFPNDSVYGCWGIKGEEYYNGRAYGTMLKQAAAAMRAVNPQVRILNGGLLLDKPYQPGNPETLAGRFLEGMLLAGAGDSFDMLSFHSYVYYNQASSLPLGPRDDWKVVYLQNVLRAYNVAAKPLIRTETAMLCVDATPECRWAQADFLVRTFVRSMRDKVVASFWYMYDQDIFHNAALIEPGDVFVPRPAYFAYRNSANMLSRAAYDGPVIGAPPGVEAYHFTRAADEIVIYWADVAQPFTLTVPPDATVTCTNRDGGLLACTNTNGKVELFAQRSPAYVVIR